MTRKLIALATAASISMAAVAPAMAQSMDMGFSMLTGAVFNELRQRGIPTDNVDNLTVSQLAQIKNILNDDMSEGQKTTRIEAIVNR